MSKVRDFAEKKDTSIPDVILKATKSSVFRINEKLHNGKQGFALTKKASHHDHRRNAKPHHSLLYSCHKIQRDPPIPLFLIRFQQPPFLRTAINKFSISMPGGRKTYIVSSVSVYVIFIVLSVFFTTADERLLILAR